MFIWCQWSNMIFLVLLNHKQTNLPITLQLSQIENLFSVVLMAAKLSSRESPLRTLNGIAGGENRRLSDSALWMLESGSSLRCLILFSSSFECYRLAHLFMARNGRWGKEMEDFPQENIVLEKEESEHNWDAVLDVIFSIKYFQSVKIRKRIENNAV